jgi:hypothetical protein
MNSKNKSENFVNLTFDDFRELAKDPGLSRHQKVGFPDSYRAGKEKDIFCDMLRKLSQLEQTEKTVLEIGPGCSELPIMLAKLCAKNLNKLIFIDSPEMLAYLPDASHISKYPGIFPEALKDNDVDFKGKVDVIIAYSVIQYVFADGNIFGFLDKCLLLLRAGGQILLGDIPNLTMRKRFFSSDAGIKSHQEYIGRDERPEILFNQIESGQMDDAVVFSILARARSQGFNAWVVPQSPTLPMANRREDILICKP